MAQQAGQLNRETFSCPLCVDLLKDPVTIPCGPSYCMNCIKSFWVGEGEKGMHSCPQCRRTFTTRPVLQKSAVLAALVEQLKKTGLQPAPADHCYAGPEHFACDICTERKLTAFRSCLFCLASFCEKNPQLHYESAPFKKLQLVEPSKNVLEKVCSRHEEVMKMFCRTDQKCICIICLMEEHKGHDTLSAAAEPEPQNRDRFLKYTFEFSLDLNTTSSKLEVNESNRTVTRTWTNVNNPDSSKPDRFTGWPQVMSREKVTGRCYWEVQWKRRVRVAVAYKDLSRAGNRNECEFGYNDKSWALSCYQSSFSFGHSNIWTSISGPVSFRVGVYLDHGAGLLSFYSVSENKKTMILLHRVQTKFTQPLHAGVWVGEESSAQFC
ncbi:tripartite motif-containing protein 16-like [Xiphophorus hellerii]|uniref:tripartite motif-containing protein 16-like n=1 Tax=Xiphophorus hellerii TaxID=8084 RepID=UPI0013B46981|nr:tripartite motif-containing protein 16-like [Xiphophorus hellerii]